MGGSDAGSQVVDAMLVIEVIARPLGADQVEVAEVVVVNRAAADEDVFAGVRAAVERVGVEAADEDVSAVATVERVVPFAAEQDVVAVAAVQFVGGHVAGDVVVAAAADHILDPLCSARGGRRLELQIDADRLRTSRVIQRVVAAQILDRASHERGRAEGEAIVAGAAAQAFGVHEVQVVVERPGILLRDLPSARGIRPSELIAAAAGIDVDCRG